MSETQCQKIQKNKTVSKFIFIFSFLSIITFTIDKVCEFSSRMSVVELRIFLLFVFISYCMFRHSLCILMETINLPYALCLMSLKGVSMKILKYLSDSSIPSDLHSTPILLASLHHKEVSSAF
jgi:hypothetical protein